jgi:hypothetical protein
MILIGPEARAFLECWTILTQSALFFRGWFVELVGLVVEWYVRLRAADIIDEINAVHKILLRTNCCVKY